MDLRTFPDGGVRLDVPARYASTLGADGSLLVDWFSSVLIAVDRLRTTDPQMTPDDWHALITDVERGLIPRLRGVSDAMIRAHAAAGGSYGDLATALDVRRSTAQYRRDQVVTSAPSRWERWATGDPADEPGTHAVTLTLTSGNRVELTGVSADHAHALEMLITAGTATATVDSDTGQHTYTSAQVMAVAVTVARPHRPGGDER